MIEHILPILMAAAIALFSSMAVYLAIRFFAYKRSFPLPRRFDFLWIVDTLLVLFLSIAFQPPLAGEFHAKFITSSIFATYLLSTYLLLFVVDQFLVEYFLVSVAKAYIAPPLRKVLHILVFLLAVLVGVQTIFSINPWAVYAPTSLVSLGIGIALKDAFLMLFSGVALSRYVRIGDWIRMGDREGQVVDINWAKTVLRAKDGSHHLIPNNELQAGSFVSFSFGSKLQRCFMDVGVSYSAQPQKVKATLLSCIHGVNGIVNHNNADVLITQFGDSAIQYRLRFWMNDYSQYNEIASEVSTRIWYAFKRDGMEIPFPIRTLHLERKGKDRAEPLDAEAMLSNVSLFTPLSLEERELLASRLRRQHYLKGEHVVRQGQPGSSFYLVFKGRVEVLRAGSDGKNVTLVELTPGQFFGELSLLTGEPRSATVRAVEDSELLRLKKEDFQEILQHHPALAESLAEAVSMRQSALSEVKGQERSGSAPSEANTALSLRIRKFFNLQTREAQMIVWFLAALSLSSRTVVFAGLLAALGGWTI